MAQKEFSGNKPYFNQLKIKFGEFFDNQNILRFGGWLQFSDLPENSKKPILLTKQSYFSHLTTLFLHLQTKHGGIKDTISQVHSNNWIISIRQFVKSIIKKCFLCQRFESKPYRHPPSGSLPPYRSKQSLPFETTGVDYLGPVLVKPILDDINGNYFYKSQIILFTCAVARAVHLEIVPNLTASSIICALKRFI